MKVTPVYLFKIKRYNSLLIKKSLKKILASQESFANFIRKGAVIWVKPNMFQGFLPSKCVTTHPSVVKAVIEIIQEKGAKVVVGDNPAGLPSGSLEKYLKIVHITGIKRVVEETGATLIYPDKAKKVNLSPFGLKEVSEFIGKVNGIINVPKLKGHGLMVISGAIKNMFGVIPGLRKLDCHAIYQQPDKFAQFLIGLERYIKPQLTIMDAIKIVDKEGSIRRKPKLVGALLAGKSSLAVDIVAAKLLRLDPLKVPVIAQYLLHEKRINFLEQISIVGSPLEDFKLPRLSFLTENLKKYPVRLARKGDERFIPKFDLKKCRFCGSCLFICPGKALRIRKEKIKFISKNCIRCYCCIEVCNYGAISLD